MAKQVLIVTGSKSLNRMLNALGSERAKKLNQQAIRVAMKVVLAEARATIPIGKTTEKHKGGLLKRSLGVRVMKRSKYRIGIVVQQREGAFKGAAYYGSFIELGWRPGKRMSRFDLTEWKITSDLVRSRLAMGMKVNEITASGEGWVRQWRRKLDRERDQVVDVRENEANVDKANKRLHRTNIAPKWYMRDAAARKESEALAIYYKGLEELIDLEAQRSGTD